MQDTTQSEQDSEYGCRRGRRGIVIENKLHCCFFGLEEKRASAE